MIFSHRAVEAALAAWHLQEGPTDREQQSAMQAALTAALAVDGVALVPRKSLQYIACESGEQFIRDEARALLSAASEGEERK